MADREWESLSLQTNVLEKKIHTDLTMWKKRLRAPECGVSDVKVPCRGQCQSAFPTASPLLSFPFWVYAESLRAPGTQKGPSRFGRWNLPWDTQSHRRHDMDNPILRQECRQMEGQSKEWGGGRLWERRVRACGQGTRGMGRGRSVAPAGSNSRNEVS